MNFEDLGLSQPILNAIKDCGYDTPTPIQEKAIPYVMMARDVVGLAQTGTGKTASFTLPMLEILAQGRSRIRMPRGLILSPTRELAAQISSNFATYGKYLKINYVLLTGGESMNDQKRLLERGVDVIIATPGRLLDLFERGSILLSDVKMLVIDEADRMLDMGFIPDIEKIIKLLPPTRQTLLFSATMPSEIERLAEKFLQNAKRVSVAPPAMTAKTVEQFLIWTDPADKHEALVHLLRNEQVKNAFIFCNRKQEASRLARQLEREGFSASPMHGDMPQNVRTETLKGFKAGTIDLLVCSDVAARGLDVEAVSHVFNYDVPINAEDYVHRIGRTGRAGMKGQAWTMATIDDGRFVTAIEKLTNTPLPDRQVADLSQDRPDLSDEALASRKKGRGGRSSAAPARRIQEKPAARGPSRASGRHYSKPPRHADEASPLQRHADVREAHQPRHVPAKRPERREDEGGPDRFGDDIPAFLRK